MKTPTEHERWMLAAVREAERAFKEGEVPVGCIITCNGELIAKGHNQIERLQDPTAHAEMIAITAAADHLVSRRLENCTLYVTMEPCPMCAGAIVLARIPVVVFGTFDPKAGACGSLFNILEDRRLNHRAHVIPGVLDDRSREMLRQFFVEQGKREAGRKRNGQKGDS